MLSLQQQYNQVPNQYVEEMRSVSVLPHLKSMVADFVADFGKVISSRQSSEVTSPQA